MRHPRRAGRGCSRCQKRIGGLRIDRRTQLQNIATRYRRLQTIEGTLAVRKRRWITRRGETKEAWIVDYVDQRGERHIKTFVRKKDADAHHAEVVVDISKGTHTPESRSLTVKQAAEHWLATAEIEKLERSTIDHYRIHVSKHIVPKIGATKLSTLTTPQVNAFRDTLLRELSRPMARKVLASFRSIIKDARRRGTIAHNVADGVTIGADKRAQRRLEVGRDIPKPDEVRRILAAAEEKLWRAFLVTAAFTGLRASEMRGLRWGDVDLACGTVHVRQRADAWGHIGQPKTHTGQRATPVGPYVVSVLKEWKLACPKGEHDLVFPAATATRWCTRQCSTPATGRHSGQPGWSMPRGSQSIPAYMRSATSSLAGASTGRRRVGSNCHSRRCSSGSAIQPSP
jgi:integrase